MRTWTRSVIRRECGRCTAPIKPGDPALRITFTVGAAVLWRCALCEGPAPDDLPALAAAPDKPASIQRIQQLLTATTRDWKQSQGNDV